MPKLSHETELEIIREYEALGGKSPAPLLQRYGIARQTLYNVLGRHGVEPHTRRPNTRAANLPDDVKLVIQMVTWHLEGLVDKRVLTLQLDQLKTKYGLD